MPGPLPGWEPAKKVWPVVFCEHSSENQIPARKDLGAGPWEESSLPAKPAPDYGKHFCKDDSHSQEKDLDSDL